MPWGPPKRAKRLLALLLVAFVCVGASALRSRSRLVMAAPPVDGVAGLLTGGVASPRGTARGIAEALSPGDQYAGEHLAAQGDAERAAQVREQRLILRVLPLARLPERN